MDSYGIIATSWSIRAADEGKEILVGVARAGQGPVGPLQAPDGEGMLGEPVFALGPERTQAHPGEADRPRLNGLFQGCRIGRSGLPENRRLGHEVAAGGGEPGADLGGDAAEGHAPLLPQVAHDEGHVALGQVTRPDLHPDRATGFASTTGRTPASAGAAWTGS